MRRVSMVSMMSSEHNSAAELKQWYILAYTCHLLVGWLYRLKSRKTGYIYICPTTRKDLVVTSKTFG